MVIKGDAAMQIMGDWAKGELSLAKQEPNVDYGCVPTPGTAGDFIWLTDNFGFFKSKDAATQAGQLAMASAILDKGFQEAFNIKKGSIPSRIDVSMDNFDYCGKEYLQGPSAGPKNQHIVAVAHTQRRHEGRENRRVPGCRLDLL